MRRMMRPSIATTLFWNEIRERKARRNSASAPPRGKSAARIILTAYQSGIYNLRLSPLPVAFLI